LNDRVVTLGFEAVGGTPEELTAQMKEDVIRWGKVICDAGIKPQ